MHGPTLHATTLLALTALAPSRAYSTAYYVNCANGGDSNSGTAIATPWRTLSKVNSQRFRPGDSILFARGVTCQGELQPEGSGNPNDVITIADYGTGSMPVISAGTHQAALELKDQSYWVIRNIETTGGDPYGIWITGVTPKATIQHIYINNVVAHNVTGKPSKKESGLIVFNTTAQGERFEDILVDGAVAYNTTQWSGIYLFGATWDGPHGVKGSNMTIRNCIVHDVGGDGIVIHSSYRALIENSIAYNTGLTKIMPVGADAIWNWNCDTCTVQNTEAYLAHTPDRKGDGGDYDSDYYNRDVTIQYNYGHDSEGYCAAVFGAEGEDTNVNTVIRYNVCANNGRDVVFSGQGDFFYSTWDSGTILNSRVYNNTSFWNPASATAYAVKVEAGFDPSQPNYFVNNIIYSKVPGMEYYNPSSSDAFQADHNLFCYAGKGAPHWKKKTSTYDSLADWQDVTGQDSHSLYTDPMLMDPTYHAVGRPTLAFKLLPNSPAIRAGWHIENMGQHDFFGNQLSTNGPVNIGAHQTP